MQPSFQASIHGEEQFPCGSQIPNRRPWFCAALQKLKAPVLLPQLENVIAAWGKMGDVHSMG
jgi:hypothetical protein